jgi:hypothetical protein
LLFRVRVREKGVRAEYQGKSYEFAALKSYNFSMQLLCGLIFKVTEIIEKIII